MNYFPTIAFSMICSFCPLLASAQDNTPITVTVETLFRYSQIDGNLPDNFPSKNSHYDKAYQGAWNNGILYTNDFGKQELLTFDRLGHRTANGYAGTSSHGIAFDDAGNLIMRDDGITETPCKLRIYRNGSDEPHDIAFYLLENGITNYISASGDIFSDEGGYVYLFPQSTYAVNIDPQLHKEVRTRYDALGLKPYGGFMNPEIVPVVKGGKVVDYRVEYPDDYLAQMLEYGRKYATL